MGSRNVNLSDEEKKEKLVLDFYFLKSEINAAEGDSKKLKEIKKIAGIFEKDLEDFLQINISVKNKKSYVNLKKTNLDQSLLKLAKYLE